MNASSANVPKGMRIGELNPTSTFPLPISIRELRIKDDCSDCLRVQDAAEMFASLSSTWSFSGIVTFDIDVDSSKDDLAKVALSMPDVTMNRVFLYPNSLVDFLVKMKADSSTVQQVEQKMRAVYGEKKHFPRKTDEPTLIERLTNEIKRIKLTAPEVSPAATDSNQPKRSKQELPDLSFLASVPLPPSLRKSNKVPLKFKLRVPSTGNVPTTTVPTKSPIAVAPAAEVQANEIPKETIESFAEDLLAQNDNDNDEPAPASSVEKEKGVNLITEQTLPKFESEPLIKTAAPEKALSVEPEVPLQQNIVKLSSDEIQFIKDKTLEMASIDLERLKLEEDLKSAQLAVKAKSDECASKKTLVSDLHLKKSQLGQINIPGLSKNDKVALLGLKEREKKRKIGQITDCEGDKCPEHLLKAKELIEEQSHERQRIKNEIKVADRSVKLCMEELESLEKNKALLREEHEKKKSLVEELNQTMEVYSSDQMDQALLALTDSDSDDEEGQI